MTKEEALLAGQFIRMHTGETLPFKPIEATLADLRRGVKPELALQHMPEGFRRNGHKKRTILGLYFPARKCRVERHSRRQCDFLCDGEAHPQGPACRFCRCKPAWSTRNTKLLTPHVAYDHLANCDALADAEDVQLLKAAFWKLHSADIEGSREKQHRRNLEVKEKRLPLTIENWKVQAAKSGLLGGEDGESVEDDVPSASEHTSGSSRRPTSRPNQTRNRKRTASGAQASDDSYNESDDCSSSSGQSSRRPSSSSPSSSTRPVARFPRRATTVETRRTAQVQAVAKPKPRDSRIEVVVTAKKSSPAKNNTTPRRSGLRSTKASTTRQTISQTQDSPSSETDGESSAGEDEATPKPRAVPSSARSQSIEDVSKNQQRLGNLRLKSASVISESSSSTTVGPATKAGKTPKVIQIDASSDDEMSTDEKPVPQLHETDRGTATQLQGHPQPRTRPPSVKAEAGDADSTLAPKGFPRAATTERAFGSDRNRAAIARKSVATTARGESHSSMHQQEQDTSFISKSQGKPVLKRGTSAPAVGQGRSGSHTATSDSDSDDSDTSMESDASDTSAEEADSATGQSAAQRADFKAIVDKIVRDLTEKTRREAQEAREAEARVYEAPAVVHKATVQRPSHMVVQQETKQQELQGEKKAAGNKRKRSSSETEVAVPAESTQKKRKLDETPADLPKTSNILQAENAVLEAQVALRKAKRKQKRKEKKSKSNGAPASLPKSNDVSQAQNALLEAKNALRKVKHKEKLQRYKARKQEAKKALQIRGQQEQQEEGKESTPATTTQARDPEQPPEQARVQLTQPTAPAAPAMPVKTPGPIAAKKKPAKAGFPLDLKKFQLILTRGGVHDTQQAYSTFQSTNSAKRFLDFDFEAYPDRKMTTAQKTQFIDAIEAFIANKPAAAGPSKKGKA